jgi:hypothetical protein
MDKWIECFLSKISGLFIETIRTFSLFLVVHFLEKMIYLSNRIEVISSFLNS